MKDLIHVSVTDSDLNIPGIYLVHDFVSAKEEQVYHSFPSTSVLLLHCFAYHICIFLALLCFI